MTWNRFRTAVPCSLSCYKLHLHFWWTSTEGTIFLKLSRDLWHQHHIFILLCTNSIVSISVFTTKRWTVSNMMKALIHPVARVLWRFSESSHNWCCLVVFLSMMPVAGARSGSTGAPHTVLYNADQNQRLNYYPERRKMNQPFKNTLIHNYVIGT